ncbi:MAG: ATP-binding cassette domain-containing protein [Firmicutes bacterium]|nr:ATP-binding cassette domain-containing protein [Bacillota bacterium]
MKSAESLDSKETASAEILMEVSRLTKTFHVKNGLWGKHYKVEAIKDISLNLFKGETLGLIGESGSGKTTLSQIILGLQKANHGLVKFHGIEPTYLRRDVQIVFQYSYGALDPLKTVFELVKEPLLLHKVAFEGTIENEVSRILALVGLSEGMMNRRVTAISGGQKQRVGIARALASRPKLLILDEPVSALDVSVQGQIVNLLVELKRQLGLTYLFITHDLRIAIHLSDRLAVMHRGEIVECEATERLLENPVHPYTKKLLASISMMNE